MITMGNTFAYIKEPTPRVGSLPIGVEFVEVHSDIVGVLGRYRGLAVDLDLFL